jgi:hypothetical protein
MGLDTKIIPQQDSVKSYGSLYATAAILMAILDLTTMQ